MPADGNLYITFISMGQGDCVIVSLPNGQNLLVDCGSVRWDTELVDLLLNGEEYEIKGTTMVDEETPIYTLADVPSDRKEEMKATIVESLRQGVIDTLFESKFLLSSNRIDALVLTHPDRDHYNELKSCLADKNPTINSIYFSGSAAKYIEGGTGHWLSAKAAVTNSYPLTINKDGYKFDGIAFNGRTDSKVLIPTEPTPAVPPPPSKPVNVVSAETATKGFVRILDGTKAGGKNCEVFLLASNVDEYKGSDGRKLFNDDSTKENRGSIVTLIVFGSKKIMLCGDATFHTEKFLKDTYGAKIADLELLQLPHHGSMTSSSWSAAYIEEIKTIDFVGHVKPRRVIVSAANDSGSSLKLPRYEVIKRYIESPGKRLVAATREVHAWERVLAEYAPSGKAKRQVLAGASDVLLARDLLFEIVSTGNIGTTDYAFTNAEV